MNVARFALRWKIGENESMITTVHTKRGDSFDAYEEGDILDLLTQFAVWWRDDFDGHDAISKSYPGSVRLIQTEGRRIQPTYMADPISLDWDLAGQYPKAFTAYYVTSSPPFIGIAPDEFQNAPCPPQTCWLITLHTSDESRHGRGRMYMPPPPREVVDDEGHYFVRADAIRDDVGGPAITFPHEQGQQLTRVITNPAGTTPNDVIAVYSRARGEALTVMQYSCIDRLATQRRRIKLGDPVRRYSA